MNDNSIRRFALNYYRQSGASVRNLDDRGDTFEVRPRDGNAVTLNFGPETETPEQALTATSPQWRRIIDDLTTEVAVSYRYLTAGPIAHHIPALTLLMPEGWTLVDAKLNRVENRQALGYSHRVTFDSPALNARREMMQHHLWDVRRAARFLALEPIFYQTPCIMLKPEQQPSESVVQHFLARSVELVDQATDMRGREIESELQDLQRDADNRITEFYRQQRQTLSSSTDALEEKLATLSRALCTTDNPQLIGRLLEERDSLNVQLATRRGAIAEKLTVIDRALTEKLAQERTRHELTAVTDLVAMCHVAYDVLLYDATVQAPNGTRFRWELSFCPVARELTLPACSRCRQAMVRPVALPDGRFACSSCVSGCKSCGAPSLLKGVSASSCHTCGGETCSVCSTACVQCRGKVCQRHVLTCACCHRPVCAPCAARCHTCGVALCFTHAHLDREKGAVVCSLHTRQPLTLADPAPGAMMPDLTGGVMAEMATSVAPSLLDQIPQVTQAPPQVVEAAPVQPMPAATPVAELEPSQPEPLLAGSDGGDRPVARAGERLVTCCGCQHTVAEVDSHVCCNCGIQACDACATGPLAPCPACESLTPTSIRDHRLQFVFRRFPHLARHNRQWEVSEMGNFVLCQWSYFGRWGMVVYHSLDGLSVVYNSFECGWLESLLQRLTSWWRE